MSVEVRFLLPETIWFSTLTGVCLGTFSPASDSSCLTFALFCTLRLPATTFFSTLFSSILPEGSLNLTDLRFLPLTTFTSFLDVSPGVSEAGALLDLAGAGDTLLDLAGAGDVLDLAGAGDALLDLAGAGDVLDLAGAGDALLDLACAGDMLDLAGACGALLDLAGAGTGDALLDLACSGTGDVLGVVVFVDLNP